MCVCLELLKKGSGWRRRGGKRLVYGDLQNILSQRCSLLSLYPSTGRDDEKSTRRREVRKGGREGESDAELGGLRRK